MDEAGGLNDNVAKDRFGCPVDLVRELVRLLSDGETGYVYHGQLKKWRLRTSLERACRNAGVAYKEIPAREREMIRHFKRLYRGDDQEAVRNDTLYCMSLMQHHGAPTRLLDWTYSPLVAVYFALEYALDNYNDERNTYESIAVWRLREKWCEEQAELNPIEYIIRARNTDQMRNDNTFEPLYLNDYPLKFVFLENPVLLHSRLHLQQGVFLCPGDIAVQFEKNITEGFKGWEDNAKNILQMTCEVKSKIQLDEAFDLLHSMNINRETLFPGLDGFAKSMWYRQCLYEKLAKERQGT